MPMHKFAVGDRVSLLPSPANPNVRPGIYTIMRAMPADGSALQYRAKSALDTHERVLDEAQLRPADR